MKTGNFDSCYGILTRRYDIWNANLGKKMNLEKKIMGIHYAVFYSISKNKHLFQDFSSRQCHYYSFFSIDSSFSNCASENYKDFNSSPPFKNLTCKLEVRVKAGRGQLRFSGTDCLFDLVYLYILYIASPTFILHKHLVLSYLMFPSAILAFSMFSKNTFLMSQ